MAEFEHAIKTLDGQKAKWMAVYPHNMSLFDPTSNRSSRHGSPPDSGGAAPYFRAGVVTGDASASMGPRASSRGEGLVATVSAFLWVLRLK
jgi:hypothetical protein